MLFLRAAAAQVQPGAWRMAEYLPMLQGKRVALLVNQTSEISGTHLLDTLLTRGVRVVKIFAPEHGFRGTADAGAHVKSGADRATGLPIISLYGSNQKPKPGQLADVDVLVYDVQDVGVRFYTFISTLQYAMEACAAAGVPVIILDRPNPNGHYVDGPVLDTSQRSFVGLQRVPVVYGMTPGEYGKMLVGERLFAGAAECSLRIVQCAGYTHTTVYDLPVPPSPNLRTRTAVLLYPSLCLFEGTPVSVGRGTEAPFTQWGAPAFKRKAPFAFLPRSVVGATDPPHKDDSCYGMRLASSPIEASAATGDAFRLQWIILAYKWWPQKDKFFTPFFDKLAGTAALRTAIAAGLPEEKIRASWRADVLRFKQVRKKYLLYPDFE